MMEPSEAWSVDGGTGRNGWTIARELLVLVVVFVPVLALLFAPVLVRFVYAGDPPVLVKDTHPDPLTSNVVTELTVVNDTLYFRGLDDTHGMELWKSDGTSAGTEMVMDILSGNSNSYPYNLTAANDILYFRADDGTHGRELWETDGTAAGTQMVGEIRPGTSSSSPFNLRVFNNRLYFFASDDTHGTALWVYNTTPPTDITLSSSSVAENQPAGTTVGTLVAIDPDDTDPFTYTLVVSDTTCTGADNASFTIDDDALKTAAVFDYETKASYDICVETSDGSSTYREAFTISVTDVGESPTAMDDTASTNEDTPEVVDVTANDIPVNAGEAVTLTASLAPTGTTAISGTSIVYTPAENFYGTEVFTYTIEGSSGITDSASVTMNVSSVNDAPVVDLNGDVDGINSTTTFTVGQSAVLLAPAVAVSDVDHTTLQSAQATLTNPLDDTAERLLVDTDSSGITASYDTASGVLTLNGEETLANYQAVLATLSYSNTATSPTTTTNRIVTVTVSDGSDSSVVAQAIVAVKADDSKPDLKLSHGPKNNVTTIRIGNIIIFLIRWENQGNSTARTVVITVVIPAGTQFWWQQTALQAGGWDCENGAAAGTECSYPVGDIGPGESGSTDFPLLVTSVPPGGVIDIAPYATDADGNTYTSTPEGGRENNGVVFVADTIIYLPMIQR